MAECSRAQAFATALRCGSCLRERIQPSEALQLSPGPVQIVRDPTDLLALPALAYAWSIDAGVRQFAFFVPTGGADDRLLGRR